MSRNVRKKPVRAATAKLTKRRTSDSSISLNLSDDEGYSAVEEISDSDDDDEEHVNAAEEEHIISNELRRASSNPSRPLKKNPDDETEGDEDDEDEDDDDEDEDQDEEDETTNEDDDGVEETEENAVDHFATWEGIVSETDEGVTEHLPSHFILGQHVERHVRFTGVPDSDSDSTTTDTTRDIDSFFPDIFVEQNSLDPAFRREIEYDDPDESSNSGSFWDFASSQEPFGADSDDDAVVFQGDDTPLATPSASRAPTEVSTPVPSPEAQELDGYETDGDTTEEDIPEPIVRKRQVRRSQSLEASDSEIERPVRFKRGQPRVGRYNLDHSDKKPIAVLNPITRKMMIFTPQKLRKLDLPPDAFDFGFLTSPDVTQSSPILSNSASVMMGAMFPSNTFDDFMNTHPMGPTEAFFSLTSDAIMGDDSDETGADDNEDDEEKNLKLEDFITFHQESSEDEEEQDMDVWGLGTDADLASTPVRPRTAASTASDTMGVHPLLSHFDSNSDAVGAFRRNQINQQLILSDKASPASLAFSGPYYHGTLRGIKSGSMEAVTAPITPVRRHKRGTFPSLSNSVGDSDRSPLETVSQKRKASSTAVNDGLHKRHRSISDMEVLHI
ncbi:hypothetical protein VTK73DRAFT_10365 [Phialemonium thermophilum]|uniref:Amidase n=1 Tax=Phialemonium thermophilum TaxID=223376 RepID=A0ABR3XH51_9PEZI